MEVIVGIASLPLKFLAYMIEFKDEDQLNVMDYSAQHCGFLQVQLLPCDRQGSEDVDMAVERPEDLVHTFLLISLHVFCLLYSHRSMLSYLVFVVQCLDYVDPVA